MSRPSSLRGTLAALLVLSSSTLFAQSATPPGHWSCTLNGSELDIRIAGDQATVSRDGSDSRVLKRREVRSGTYFTDGTVALKYLGDAPSSINSPSWAQNGQVSGLERCRELAG